MNEQPDVLALLKQLESERADLTVTIAQLRKRLGMPAANADDAASSGSGDEGPGRDNGIVTGRIRPDEFFKMTVPDAVVRYLSIVKKPQNPKAIVDALQAGGFLTQAKRFYANVNKDLMRMRQQKKLVNTPAGWALADWYEGRANLFEVAKPKRRKHKGTKALPGPSAAPFKKSAKPAEKVMTWHRFLGEKAKEHKTMKQAAEEWKALKGK